MPANKITALIVDDEKMGRDALKILLRNYLPEVELLGMADSVAAASKLINELNPELVFLDVEMPQEDGFALFKYHPNPTFQVIFVTAFDRYAIRALRLSALDYLLKPVDLEELEAAVAKAIDQRGVPTNGLLLGQAVDLARQVELEKIAVVNNQGFDLVPLAEIVRLEADSNYTTLYLREARKQVVSRPLGYFEELLPSNSFYRVHASHVVHLKYVNRYVKGRGGYLELADGGVVPVAARKKNEFLRLFGLR